VDTLPVFKATFPGRTSYKQQDLASGIGIEYDAHNADDDVNCLSKLVCAALKADEKCLVTKSFPPKDVKNNLEANKQKRSNMPSLSVLVASGLMKNATAENIASSGLNFHHLKVIHKRQGEDGLRSVFTMRNSEGQPRVTNVKKVLDSVLPKLADFYEKLTPSS
jgi:DNA polymerase III epsilon subunit-like protein